MQNNVSLGHALIALIKLIALFSPDFSQNITICGQKAERERVS